MRDRISVPREADIVDQLRELGDPRPVETEEVIALQGFVGPGKEGHVRLYPDPHLQRWMDFHPDDIVDSHPLRPDPAESGRGRHPLDGRHVVWVRQDTMIGAPVFPEDALTQEDFTFVEGKEMSIWPLIPQDRYIAAQLLDLVLEGDEWQGNYGG